MKLIIKKLSSKKEETVVYFDSAPSVTLPTESK
jgi:hypothetical protein